MTFTIKMLCFCIKYLKILFIIFLTFKVNIYKALSQYYSANILKFGIGNNVVFQMKNSTKRKKKDLKYSYPNYLFLIIYLHKYIIFLNKNFYQTLFYPIRKDNRK